MKLTLNMLDMRETHLNLKTKQKILIQILKNLNEFE